MDGMVGMDPRDLPDHQVHQDNQGHKVSKNYSFFLAARNDELCAFVRHISFF